MPIEYRPPTLSRVPDNYLENREADVTCNQCGVLGGGTLSALEAKEEAEKHDRLKPDHNIVVSEVSCFM